MWEVSKALVIIFFKYQVSTLIVLSSLPAQHPCTHACHAPSVCPEDEPCQSLLTLTCSCGRIRQAVHCGRSSSNADGNQRGSLKCNNECSIAKRNAKLADALGITPESRGKVSVVSYHEELITFAKANPKFLGIVEKALAECVCLLDEFAFIHFLPLAL